MQKTNFFYEVLVYDDASADGTTDIIRQYVKRYPEIIKPILQTENQFSKGVYVDKTFNWPRIQGKYVALCDGDDYWTDPDKLQKQVDFLDAHQSCSVCFHPVRIIWENHSGPDSIFPSEEGRFYKTMLDLDDLLQHNFIQTNSVMYRWRFSQGDFADMPDKILPHDWFLHLLHAQVGKIGFLPDVMAVYRKNSGSLWDGAGISMSWFNKCFLRYLYFLDERKNRFGYNVTYELISSFIQLLVLSKQNNNWDLFEKAKQNSPQLWTDCLNVMERRCFFPYLYWKYKCSWGAKRIKNKQHYYDQRNAYRLAKMLRDVPKGKIN